MAALALVLAGTWNLSPHAWSYSRSASEHEASHQEYWQPAVNYLTRHLTPSYRVETVDTAGHWAAVYLPRAGIPLTRGWFRQDDFPQNEVLYDELDGPTYLGWLRSLGVKYVVLIDAPTDYSSKREALLIRSGLSGLKSEFRGEHIRIYSVPKPQPIVTGQGMAEMVELAQTQHHAQPRLSGELPDRRPLLAVLEGRRQHRVHHEGRRRDDASRSAASGPPHAPVQGEGGPRPRGDGGQPPGLRRAD